MTSLKAANWRALRNHVKSGRAKMGWTQEELAEAAGVSKATIQSIERAEPRTRLPDSVPKIEIALRWAPGTAERILEVEGIELSPDEAQEILDALDRGGVSERARRIVSQLLDGPD